MVAVSFTASELLVIWEDAHGELSPEWRERFLADERVQEFTRLDTFIARPAIERNQKLDQALEDANAAIKRRSSRQVKRKTEKDPRSRFRYGHFPHQPNDADIHKRIGPTQNYQDDI